MLDQSRLADPLYLFSFFFILFFLLFFLFILPRATRVWRPLRNKRPPRKANKNNKIKGGKGSPSSIYRCFCPLIQKRGETDCKNERATSDSRHYHVPGIEEYLDTPIFFIRGAADDVFGGLSRSSSLLTQRRRLNRWSEMCRLHV